jgi:hypothetical protein
VVRRVPVRARLGGEALEQSQFACDLGQPHGYVREVLFGLLPEFEQALDQSGLGFLDLRLTSLDLGHHDSGVLQRSDGLVVIHDFSLTKLTVISEIGVGFVSTLRVVRLLPDSFPPASYLAMEFNLTDHLWTISELLS